MIDDSICYLIHDMIGLNYRTIDFQDPNADEPEQGWALQEWLERQSSPSDRVAWAREDLSALGLQEWVDALRSAGLTRPREVEGYCMCENHANIFHDDDPRIDPYFMHEFRLSIGATTMRFATPNNRIARDLDGRIRQALGDTENDYGRSYASETLGRDVAECMANTMEFTYPVFSSFGLSGVDEFSITVPAGVFIYLINEVGAGVPLTGTGDQVHDIWSVNSSCFDEVSEVSVNISSRRSNYVYAGQVKLEFHESLSYTGRWNRVSSGYGALGGMLYDDLYSQYLDYYERPARQSLSSNMSEVINLTRMRHTVRDCAICQDRMEFTPREAANSIRELVHT